MNSYNHALKITLCESIQTALRTRRRMWAGVLVGISDGWLPKRFMFGNFEGAMWRGRGGKDKK